MGESSNSIKNEIAIFNNTVSNAISLNIKDTSEKPKIIKDIQLKENDLGSIETFANNALDSNPELTNEQIATKVLEKLAESHHNPFIRKLSQKMVKNKWGVRHGG